MRPGVAAGHPATTDVGAEILADGGTAADAVVAMALASCVGETVMSGLLAGCHAMVYDGSRTMHLDGFAAVPSRSADLTELPVAFGEELVTYSIGPASCAVPGLPAALDELWRSHGRLPWTRLVEPALGLARAGVPLPPMHARTLEMLGALYSLERGAELFVRGARMLEAGETLDQPGLVEALEAIAEEGAASVYTGTLARRLLAMDGVVVTRGDLEAYEPRWREPAVVTWNGYTRGDARRAVRGSRAALAGSRVSHTSARPSASCRSSARSRPQTSAVSTRRTWSPSTATGERASSRTAWASARASGCPASTRSSTTCSGRPTSHTASPGRETTSRAAWRPRSSSTTTGSRSRSARRARPGSGPHWSASSRRSSTKASTPSARSHGHASTPRPTDIDAEPGVDERALEALESRGRNVRRWDRLHHYFGGVSCVGRTGAAGDPRRSGTALSSLTARSAAACRCGGRR